MYVHVGVVIIQYACRRVDTYFGRMSEHLDACVLLKNCSPNLVFIRVSPRRIRHYQKLGARVGLAKFLKLFLGSTSVSDAASHI